MRFSQRLKQLRRELNLRQDDLARACGVKLTAISKYENEIIKPAFDMLSKMGLAYNVNLNWLVNEIGNMFIEKSSSRLIKTGSGDFVSEQEQESCPVTVMTDTHNMELENDLKVEYYGLNNENITKIYRKDGNVEYEINEDEEERIREITKELSEISKNENQYEFVLTAIKALKDDNAFQELKTMIKGMELAKRK